MWYKIVIPCCPPVRKIIHSQKLVDYLHVQADNPLYNYYLAIDVSAQKESEFDQEMSQSHNTGQDSTNSMSTGVSIEFKLLSLQQKIYDWSTSTCHKRYINLPIVPVTSTFHLRSLYFQ